MTDPGEEVIVLVVAAAPELGGRVNSALRGRGLFAQVDWARDVADARDQMGKRDYDLVFGDVPTNSPDKLAELGDAADPALPVIGLAEEIDDELMEDALNAGLRDLVLIERSGHIAAVAKRELSALSSLRAVGTSRQVVEKAERDRETLFSQSGDALAQVEDGFIVRANAAWGELFGAESVEVGTPVMDLFHKDDRGSLRDGLRTRETVTLDIAAKGEGGIKVPVSVAIRPLDGDDAGQLELAIRSGSGQRTLAEQLERAKRQDSDTGMLNRNAFVEMLQSATGRSLVLVRIDNFARVIEQMGVLGSNDVSIQFAHQLAAALPDGATAGRIEGAMFGVTLGDQARDAVTAVCDGIREVIAKATFDYADRSTHLTASFGVRLPGAGSDEAMLDDALTALRSASAGGGDRIEVYAPPETAVPERREESVSDEEWANRIKIALMKRHFRVALQAVASLRGDTTDTNDLLLRLHDPERGEILPGEFLPAAERVGLTTAIDRWVLGEAMRLLAEPSHRKSGTVLFVRLSDDAITDPSTLKWMETQLKAAKLEHGRLVVEVSAEQVEKRLRETKRLTEGLKALGCGVLLSHFGTDAPSSAMLAHLTVDYVKFDIDALTGIARNDDRQKALGLQTETLRERGIRTIAPQVEDANAMAVLWQVGVDFVQGNYLQEPEVVIADS